MTNSSATITDPASAIELLIALLGAIDPSLHKKMEIQITQALLTDAASLDQVEERHYQALRQLQSVFLHTASNHEEQLKTSPALLHPHTEKPAWLVAVIEGGKNDTGNA